MLEQVYAFGSVFRRHEQSSWGALFLFPVNDSNIQKPLWRVQGNDCMFLVDNGNDLLNKWDEDAFCVCGKVAFEAMVIGDGDWTVFGSGIMRENVEDSNFEQVCGDSGTCFTRASGVTEVVLGDDCFYDANERRMMT